MEEGEGSRVHTQKKPNGAGIMWEGKGYRKQLGQGGEISAQTAVNAVPKARGAGDWLRTRRGKASLGPGSNENSQIGKRRGEGTQKGGRDVQIG